MGVSAAQMKALEGVSGFSSRGVQAVSAQSLGV